jgi:formate--tetrahydrofolate ligase
LENTPAFVHGGPFANIAHGCSSLIATQTALKLADFVVTEAGFGADLGAEKFIDIKCRKAGLKPSLVVVVATIRALKYHGGTALEALQQEDVQALTRGISNLERHINNIRNHFGLPCVVALNRFASDTEAELAALKDKVAHHGVKVIPCDHWARGGVGAEALAAEVVDEIAHIPPDLHFVYEDSDTLWTKINKIAGKLYGANKVMADTKIRGKIAHYQVNGYGHYPICIAKTQYSFSTDPMLLGAPSGHALPIQDCYLAAGAEFLVVLCGHIMTMPGLPKQPAAERIDVDERGQISGLF